MIIAKVPSKSLSHALLKSKPSREQFEQFKDKLCGLIEHIRNSPGESEEHHKNHISDFLKYAFKFPTYFINTNDRIDLVIHNGKLPSDSVGVIIEAKSPTNKAQMPTLKNINVKAMQELVLYYLRERIAANNLSLKHLIITNGYEWFIFDAHFFEKAFAQDKALVKGFIEFEAKSSSGYQTDFFYKEIAKPAIKNLVDIEFTYFDLREKTSEKSLINLFKLLSPEHLLKLPFANDSNSLNKDFYNELLHIIGLIEVKEGSKKLIRRNEEGARNRGSLLENAIHKLDALDRLRNFDNLGLRGETKEEQLFTVGLELVITWINRILFLKLLEAQLVTFHNTSYAFLSSQNIRSFDELDELFFSVLARKPDEREEGIKQAFAKVPYLNSSLFEQTEIERKSLFIGNLAGELTLPIFDSTVLKDTNGKRKTGDLNTLGYLFAFLDAYDFASDSTGELREDNKALINASVLGLIFEKINGYKDGSFFTPGFITMYMCRETLHGAVISKFNKEKNWDCKNLNDIYNNIKKHAEARNEANAIINSLTICDPAVGSGHFLVSALNELISIKSRLEILQDAEGKRLKNYSVEIINDVLSITDEDGEEFSYRPSNAEAARIQKMLFHEKQTLIENCLFGVDINPNSVKICRLRLWIELLKNAYYNDDGQLETLPNIDINIKIGNSLISRFGLDSDLKDALNKSKLSLADYRNAVDIYRNASSKEQKREMELLITKIKNDFRTEILHTDPKAKKLEDLRVQLKSLELPQTLLGESLKEKREREQISEKLKLQFDKLSREIAEINKIYENAFEWRFEFPEALNEGGEFVGFDVVLGNPPYIDSEAMTKTMTDVREYCSNAYSTAKGNWDLFVPFIELSHRLSITKTVSLIIPNKWLGAPYSAESRHAYKGILTQLLDFSDVDVFTEAGVSAIVVFFDGAKNSLSVKKFTNNFAFEFENEIGDLGNIEPLSPVTSKHFLFLRKIQQSNVRLSEHYDVYDSATTSDAYSLKALVHNLNNEQDDDVLKLVTTGTVQRYCTSWGIDKTSYLKEKFDKPVVNRFEYKRQFNNKAKYMFEPKVVITGMRHLRGFMDVTGEYLAGKTTRIALAKKGGHGLRTLLVLINSKLLSFYLSESYRSASMGGGINISPELLNGLPIPRIISPLKKAEIEDLADKIRMAKTTIPQADTTALEQRIEQLVYTLYDLTPAEIALVEGM